MSSISAGAGPSPTGLHQSPNLARRSRPAETVIKALLMASALISVAITVGIVLALIEPVIHFFGEVPFSDFFATEGKLRGDPTGQRAP